MQNRLYGSGFKSGSTTLDPTTAYLHLYFGEKTCCFFLHIFFLGMMMPPHVDPCGYWNLDVGALGEGKNCR